MRAECDGSRFFRSMTVYYFTKFRIIELNQATGSPSWSFPPSEDIRMSALRASKSTSSMRRCLNCDLEAGDFANAIGQSTAW